MPRCKSPAMTDFDFTLRRHGCNFERNRIILESVSPPIVPSNDEDSDDDIVVVGEVRGKGQEGSEEARQAVTPTGGGSTQSSAVMAEEEKELENANARRDSEDDDVMFIEKVDGDSGNNISANADAVQLNGMPEIGGRVESRTKRTVSSSSTSSIGKPPDIEDRRRCPQQDEDEVLYIPSTPSPNLNAHTWSPIEIPSAKEPQLLAHSEISQPSPVVDFLSRPDAPCSSRKRHHSENGQGNEDPLNKKSHSGMESSDATFTSKPQNQIAMSDWDIPGPVITSVRSVVVRAGNRADACKDSNPLGPNLNDPNRRKNVQDDMRQSGGVQRTTRWAPSQESNTTWSQRPDPGVRNHEQGYPRSRLAQHHEQREADGRGGYRNERRQFNVHYNGRGSSNGYSGKKPWEHHSHPYPRYKGRNDRGDYPDGQRKGGYVTDDHSDRWNKRRYAKDNYSDRRKRNDNVANAQNPERDSGYKPPNSEVASTAALTIATINRAATIPIQAQNMTIFKPSGPGVFGNIMPSQSQESPTAANAFSQKPPVSAIQMNLVGNAGGHNTPQEPAFTITIHSHPIGNNDISTPTPASSGQVMKEHFFVSQQKTDDVKQGTSTAAAFDKEPKSSVIETAPTYRSFNCNRPNRTIPSTSTKGTWTHSRPPVTRTNKEILELIRTCRVCKRNFGSRSAAILHLKNQHEMKLCFVCYKTFSVNGTEYLNHYINEHTAGDDQQRAPCPVCSEKYRIGGMYIHIAKEHMPGLEPERKKPKENSNTNSGADRKPQLGKPSHNHQGFQRGGNNFNGNGRSRNYPTFNKKFHHGGRGRGFPNNQRPPFFRKFQDYR